MMLKLNVPDMSCGHCVGTITQAIKAVDPQADVKTDLASRTVTVETKVALEKITHAIDDAGYPNTLG